MKAGAVTFCELIFKTLRSCRCRGAGSSFKWAIAGDEVVALGLLSILVGRPRLGRHRVPPFDGDGKVIERSGRAPDHVGRLNDNGRLRLA